MAKRVKKLPKMWVYSPRKLPKPRVPDDLKAEISKASEMLIEELKRKYVEDSRKDHRLNYIVDIYTKWYGRYFYFCTKYKNPRRTAIERYFESRFARMEYVGEKRFNLSYMRYTGEWVEMESGQTIDKCLGEIKLGVYYIP